jgi:MoaA/NifB/PqqE/SkfB family radical SAM enzyme
LPLKIFSHPVLCNYYVTYRCNAQCGFCDIWEKPSPYVNIENVEENLKALKKLGVQVVDFTGGEPLLHRDIGEFLALAKKQKFITTLTTNALLYPKFARQLQGNVDMLHFSLDSPVREEHNKSRGVDCFDRVIESIALALSLGEKPDILFTVHEENVHQIKQMYEEITAPNKITLILNPIFRYNDVGSQISEHAIRSLNMWGRKKRIYINDGFLKLRREGGNQIQKPICKAASTTIVISPENSLLLPCYHLGLESIPIHNNLIELRNSDAIKTLISQEGTHDRCQGCTINCAMQPSFATEINGYFFAALPSTIKYSWEKQMWKSWLASKF